MLVVVAIIGMLASVVISSVSSARTKAKDVAIKAEVQQLRTIMEENYTDYGSYAYLQPNSAWVPENSSCAAYVTGGTYAAKVQQICQQIITWQSGSIAPQPNRQFYLGVSGGDTQKYSILVYLPGANTYWCVGSSGNSGTDPGTWNNPGCLKNP